MDYKKETVAFVFSLVAFVSSSVGMCQNSTLESYIAEGLQKNISL